MHVHLVARVALDVDAHDVALRDLPRGSAVGWLSIFHSHRKGLVGRATDLLAGRWLRAIVAAAAAGRERDAHDDDERAHHGLSLRLRCTSTIAMNRTMPRIG